ncbi:uncharacterized protein [Primulina eburnea]|uniref:uncharacterized protein isoform X2 n=1 Tax=Primulina eburnea TaxID=1245227 RepID=UPI003C6C93D7
MATQVVLALFLSLFCLSKVSSAFKLHQETSPMIQMLSKRERKLLHKSTDLPSYFKDVIVPPTLEPNPTPAPAPAPAPSPTTIHCDELCKTRCSLNSRPNLCTRACGTCCARCNCVPPGTFGNREMCGTCYTDMITHHNKTKCP